MTRGRQQTAASPSCLRHTNITVLYCTSCKRDARFKYSHIVSLTHILKTHYNNIYFDFKIIIIFFTAFIAFWRVFSHDLATKFKRNPPFWWRNRNENVSSAFMHDTKSLKRKWPTEGALVQFWTALIKTLEVGSLENVDKMLLGIHLIRFNNFVDTSIFSVYLFQAAQWITILPFF